MLNFDPWDRLLRQYVDSSGRVNYRAWKVESLWELRDWLEGVGDAYSQETLSYNEQFAFWINLYNALTVSKVLRQYPIESIQPKIFGFPNWLGFLWFFYQPIYPLRGRKYSLSSIEHRILRKQFDDPRIHFAIVCASIGCPLLRNAAYYPETVNDQLQEDCDRFINNPDKVYYSSDTNTLYCSQIFKWYKQDFLKQAPSLPEYIQPFLKDAPPLSASTPVQYLSYDWSLNGQTLDCDRF